MKYEFTGEEQYGLKRIRRLRDGLVGGWIESERNLSQEGECFVYDNAWVWGNARVRGNAMIYGNAIVHDDARVFGDALVYGNAQVYGNALVHGDSEIYDNAWVCEGRVYDTLIFGSRSG